MADDMKFWNRDTERVKGTNFKGWCGGVAREALRKILSPLTADVICDNGISKAGFDIVCKGRCNGIVNVDVSEYKS